MTCFHDPHMFDLQKKDVLTNQAEHQDQIIG